ncbi:MAG: hypothetical protein GY869_06155 [Planctomycetes bacterium]|nr:hypothetical protein [Planctomycetota bacterium]
MKKFGTSLILVMSLCFLGGGVGLRIVEGGIESEQGRLIREIKPKEKVAPPDEKVAVEEKVVEAAVKVVEPCQVAELQAGDDQGVEEIVEGQEDLGDVPGVLANVDIKTWLIVGGVVMLVMVGMAILSTRKVTID